MTSLLIFASNRSTCWRQRLGLLLIAIVALGNVGAIFNRPMETTSDPESNTEAVAEGMKLQWRNGSGTYVDVPVQGLYVKKGTSVTFKAVPVPDGSSFPDGPPTWSGTSGISGTGETASVTLTGSSSSMGDSFSVIATSGALSVSTGVVSWEDSASIQLTLEESDSAAFYATVTFKLWTPDYSGNGQPSSSGGSAKLYLTPSFDGFDGSSPPDLQYFTQWTYSNGVAQTQTYTIQTGIHNSSASAPDAGPTDQGQSSRAPGNAWQMYFPILRDLRVGSEMDALADDTAGSGTVAAVVKQPSSAGAAPTVVQTVSMGYDLNTVSCTPEPEEENGVVQGNDVSMVLSTSANVAPLHKRWDLWRLNPAISVFATFTPATISINGNNYSVETVSAIWTNDAAVKAADGWSQSGSLKVLGACFTGRTATIGAAPGRAYTAGVWFDFSNAKKARTVNGGGVSSWFFPSRTHEAELAGSEAIIWH